MSLLSDQGEFLARTRTFYETHLACADAHGTDVFYSLEDVRGAAEPHLRQQACPVCRGPLRAANLVIEHKVPPARGGRYTLRNLLVICRGCAVLKGALDHQEFRELLSLMSHWPRGIRAHFCKQLRAGASLVRTAARPRADGDRKVPGDARRCCVSALGHDP
jgi:hypothetical protein